MLLSVAINPVLWSFLCSAFVDTIHFLSYLYLPYGSLTSIFYQNYFFMINRLKIFFYFRATICWWKLCLSYVNKVSRTSKKNVIRKIISFKSSVAFHVKARHSFCGGNQTTLFYMEYNTGLKWVNHTFVVRIWKNNINKLVIASKFRFCY